MVTWGGWLIRGLSGGLSNSLLNWGKGNVTTEKKEASYNLKREKSNLFNLGAWDCKIVDKGGQNPN